MLQHDSFNAFEPCLCTGVVDRSPTSDLEFEQGGSPLVSVPTIPVVHLLNDSQLFEKVLKQFCLKNLINNVNTLAETYVNNSMQ